MAARKSGTLQADVSGTLQADDYARHLLDDLGLSAHAANLSRTLSGTLSSNEDHPALAWRRAGMMQISGPPDSPGLVAPVALASTANGALQALQALAPNAPLPPTGCVVLGERGRIRNTSRRGWASPNNFSFLFPTADGHIVITLARQDDWDMLPALTFGAIPEQLNKPEELRPYFKQFTTEELVTQGHLIGLAIAAHGLPREMRKGRKWMQNLCPQNTPAKNKTPLVVDLSSLWAGPLASSLLLKLGARVVKLETASRPDGARGGNQDFYNLLNGGKQNLALDFATAQGREKLAQVLDAADIVIEASRPRALRQLGIDAEAMVRNRPGKLWLSLTAYGRHPDYETLIGFGDDIAASAGLSGLMEAGHDTVCFAGDAFADSLTGLHAALAAWGGYLTGGGLIDMALHDVVSHAIASDPAVKFTAQGCDAGRIKQQAVAWQALAEQDEQAETPFYPMREIPESAGELGADTAKVLDDLNLH